MPSEKSKEKLIVGILHDHSGELSTTIGVIEVDSIEQEDKVAEGHIEFWLAAKKRKHRCKDHGDRCSVDVRTATPSLKTVMLLASAEPIVPQATIKGDCMQNQKGFSLIEALMVAAIIAIIFAITISALIRARVNSVVDPFKTHFGVDVSVYSYEHASEPPDRWLTAKQKDALRPYVEKQLAELCSTSRAQAEDSPPALDPAAVQLRLKAIHSEGTSAESMAKACEEAKTAARQLGVLRLDSQ